MSNTSSSGLLVTPLHVSFQVLLHLKCFTALRTGEYFIVVYLAMLSEIELGLEHFPTFLAFIGFGVDVLMYDLVPLKVVRSFEGFTTCAGERSFVTVGYLVLQCLTRRCKPLFTNVANIILFISVYSLVNIKIR